jgi:hypothetical protein
MRKKHKVVTLAGTYGVPVTEVETKNQFAPKDRATLLRELQAEEQAERDARDPIKTVEKQLSANLRHLRSATAAFWQQNLADLQKSWTSEAAVDPTFSVPSTRDSFTFEEAKASFETWHAETMSKSPYSFASEQAGARQVLFGLAQAKAGQDMSNPAAWQAAFEHMLNGGYFAPDDIVVEESKLPRPAEPVAPKPSITDLEQIAIGAGTNSERRAKALVNQLVSLELQPVFDRYQTYLKETWGFVTTDEQFNSMLRWWTQNPSANPLTSSAWTQMRLSLIAQSVFPPELRTADEVAAQELESVDLTRLGYDERTRLMTRLKRLQS